MKQFNMDAASIVSQPFLTYVVATMYSVSNSDLEQST